jgi:hypothetical protein
VAWPAYETLLSDFSDIFIRTDDTATRNLGPRRAWRAILLAVRADCWFDGASPFPAACRGHEPVIGIWLWLGFLEESGSGVIE